MNPRIAAVVFLVACGGGDATPVGDGGTSAGPPTFYQDVAPILGRHCAPCHTRGGIGPFSMATYEDVRPHAARIWTEVDRGVMPPFLVDDSGDCETFENNNTVSDSDKALIRAWVDGGALEGDPANAAEVISPGLPVLAEIDAETDIGVSYTPDPAPPAADDYRCFLGDEIAGDDQFLVGYDVIPGDARVVHHVVVYMPSSPAAQSNAEGLADADPSPGYSCFGGAGVSADVVAVWAPGQGATRFPTGTGVRLPGGRKPIIQVHYNIDNGAFSDRTSLNLDIEPAVAEEASIYLLGVAGGGDTIPPNAAAHRYDYQLPAPFSATIHGVFPHMHNFGVSQVMRIRDECRMNVPRWDFHWQFFYFYSSPFEVGVGDSIAIECTYDTRGSQVPVSFGEDTSDEMCIVGLYVTTP